MTTPATPDSTMESIGRAVMTGRTGDVAGARAALLDLWREIGSAGDPFHRCTLAHYLADLYAAPAEALAWDVRALDAADALTDPRVQEHHADLSIAGFYPSLHLNLADDYRRLGAFDSAREHVDAARARTRALPADEYGDLIRTAIEGVGEAIARGDTRPRPSAPGGDQIDAAER